MQSDLAMDVDLSGRIVAVLSGGRSGEREVSLASGAAVVEALRAGPGAPAQVVPVELASDGRWRIEDAAPLAVAAAIERLARVDVFFVALHGGEGEDGTLQGLLRSLGKRFTGSDVGPSAACMDKVFARHLAASQGLAVARAVDFDRAQWLASRSTLRAELAALGGAGWVVKPRRGGSSVATALVEQPSAREGALERAIEAVLETGDEVLVEERVRGVETTCPVLGNRDEELVALTPVEIRPHEGRFFDYEEKYSAGGARELCPPESLDAATVAEIGALARRAHRFFRLDGYSRTDFLVPPGAGARPVFLESNTLPGLTPRSLLPLSAARSGIAFDALCRRIVAAALRRSC